MDTGNKYEVQLDLVRQAEHDYFLQDILPQTGEAYYCARLLKKKVVRAALFIEVDQEGQAYSLRSAPFGGIWINGKVNSEAMQFFLRSLLIALRELKVNALRVVQAPGPYGKDTAMVHYILKKQGFELEQLLLHHFINGRRHIKNYLQEKTPKWQQKTKKQQLHAEVGFINTFNFLKDIKRWRGLKDHAYGVNEEKLIQQVGTYPDRYHLVSVYHQEQPVAHVLCVQLTSNSLYYYLPAIDPQALPSYIGEAALFEVVRLADSLGVDFIDLGSSDLGHDVNHSLLRFKSKHANLTDNKLIWKIKL